MSPSEWALKIADEIYNGCPDTGHDVSDEIIKRIAIALDEQRDRVYMLRGALLGVSYGCQKKCFCGVSIGDPRMSDHSQACKYATHALEEAMSFDTPKGGA